MILKVIFEESMTREWPARKNWVNSEDGTININFLKNLLGQAQVCVSICEEGQYGDQTKMEMNGLEYFELWKKETPGKGK